MAVDLYRTEKLAFVLSHTSIASGFAYLKKVSSHGERPFLACLKAMVEQRDGEKVKITTVLLWCQPCFAVTQT